MATKVRRPALAGLAALAALAVWAWITVHETGNESGGGDAGRGPTLGASIDVSADGGVAEAVVIDGGSVTVSTRW